MPSRRGRRGPYPLDLRPRPRALRKKRPPPPPPLPEGQGWPLPPEPDRAGAKLGEAPAAPEPPAGMIVCLVAGSASGDMLGAALMRALADREPDIRFAGTGGPRMAAAGLAPLFELRPPRAFPPLAALPFGRIARTVRAAVSAGAEVLVTLDDPGFTLAVARRVRRRQPDLPIVHYGVPEAWIRRPRRARRMRKVIDRLLALMPGELPLLEAAGIGCEFVGHPVAEAAAVEPEAAARYRAELGVRPGQPLVLLAPGARRGQMRRNLRLFRRAVEGLRAEWPGLAAVVPVPAGMLGPVEAAVAGMTPVPHLVRPEAGERQVRLAMAGADVALVAPGPAMLELAAARTPMVACSRASLLEAVLARLRRRGETANLVNLLTETDAVPDLRHEQARPETVTQALSNVLHDEEARADQLALLAEVVSMLGRGGEAPSARAALAVLRLARFRRPAAGEA